MSRTATETPTDTPTRALERHPSPWRIAAWSAASLVLLIPLIAMQVTDEVVWSVNDFVFAGALVLSVGIPLELAVRASTDPAYRWAVSVALVATFLLVWLSLGVGIIGADGDPANLLYGVVLAVGVLGALVVRARPRGMARVMAATALAQASVAMGALVAGLGAPYSGPLQIVVLNGGFVALWVGAALLFRRAARTPSHATQAQGG